MAEAQTPPAGLDLAQGGGPRPLAVDRGRGANGTAGRLPVRVCLSSRGQWQRVQCR
jgi:hypothetical protein